MSQASLHSLQAVLYPWAQRLLDIATHAGVRPRVTSTLRSHLEQKRLYDLWVSGKAAYPVAVPYTSAHEYGYAFDMVADNQTDQTDLGYVWSSWGGIYGGTRDPVHFEFPNWQALVPTDQAGSPVASAAPSSLGTAGSTVYRLADIVLEVLPFSSILGRTNIANALLQAFGYDNPLFTFWLSHPAEFIRDVYDIFWGMVRDYYGSIF